MHHHHVFNVEYEIMDMYYISNFIREAIAVMCHQLVNVS